MNAHEFLKAFGAEEAKTVAARAGTNLPYFRQLACGARRPSVELADRLVEASAGRLEFARLLTSKRAQKQAA